MTYTIALADAADLSTITDIQWSALRDNSLIQTLYPRGPTPELAWFTSASYARATKYSSVRLLKAIDDRTGQVVAFAKWIIYKHAEQERQTAALQGAEASDVQRLAEWGGDNPQTQHPPHCYVRALSDWNNRIAKMRNEIIALRQQPCMCGSKHSLSCYFASYSPNLYVLDIIHTHPSQQGKGAGARLVQWGTDLADKVGSQCYVETPVAGYSLFRKSGFLNVTEMGLDLGGYKAGLTRYKHIVMFRPSYGLVQPERPPPVPPKDYERSEISVVENDPVWDASSESYANDSPTHQYTAEARRLDIRSSKSTGSPKVGSVAAIQKSASTRSSAVSKLGSSFDVCSSSSKEDERPSLLANEGPEEYDRTSTVCSISAQSVHAPIHPRPDG